MLICAFLPIFRASADHQDLPGPLAPIACSFEKDKPESSQRISTPLEEESAFPELYSALMSQMDHQ